MLDSLTFPTALFGTLSTTRSNWRRIIARAVRLGSIRAATAHEPTMAFPDNTGELILGRTLYGLTRNDATSHWRLYWIGHSRELFGWERLKPTRWAQFIIEGMDELWFTLGLLVDGQFPQSSWIKDESFASVFRRLVFAKFIRWLPEIVALRSRFSTESLSTAQIHEAVSCTWWMDNIIDSLREIDNTIVGSWRNEIVDEYECNLIAWLTATGAIHQTASGFEAQY